MEVHQIQCKFPKVSNGGYASTIVSQREKMDDDEDEGANARSNLNSADPGGGGGGGGVVGLYGWPSSRIVRVSRATGGKDRHSKVLTSRGLRDRRVRLSVNTAIEFYDLQDRLGYDQPSKAVEWLLAAAANSIAELPPMNSPFPDSNQRPNEAEKADRSMMLADSAVDGGGINRGGSQQEAKSSVGSSSSENSKGSRPSNNSRSENRFRAREKAKGRENEKSSYVASFTELLSGGGINYTNGSGKDASVYGDRRPISGGNSDHQSNFFQKFPMDYFSSGLPGPPATSSPAYVAAAPLLSSAADHHPDLQPFSFTSDHLVSAANPSAINRGTLQSNSSSLHLPPNLFGGDAAPAGNHHRHFFPGFDPRLHLYYRDAAEGNDGGTKRKDKP